MKLIERIEARANRFRDFPLSRLVERWDAKVPAAHGLMSEPQPYTSKAPARTGSADHSGKPSSTKDG